jgi:hypothetical protein
MQYHLVIKAASNAEARQAAMDNGVNDIITTTKHPTYDEVYMIIGDEPMETLQLWYNNPLMGPVNNPIENMGPFPTGALLFFTIYNHQDV